jgi:hypothetical protein
MLDLIKIAVFAAFGYVLFIVSVKLIAMLIARFAGSLIFEASRPAIFICNLLFWILAFSLAYKMMPPFRSPS